MRAGGEGADFVFGVEADGAALVGRGEVKIGEVDVKVNHDAHLAFLIEARIGDGWPGVDDFAGKAHFFAAFAFETVD